MTVVNWGVQWNEENEVQFIETLSIFKRSAIHHTQKKSFHKQTRGSKDLSILANNPCRQQNNILPIATKTILMVTTSEMIYPQTPSISQISQHKYNFLWFFEIHSSINTMLSTSEVMLKDMGQISQQTPMKHNKVHTPCAQFIGCAVGATGRHPDSKVHGANMGPTWVLSAPGRPHVGPRNLAIRAGIPGKQKEP